LQEQFIGAKPRVKAKVDEALNEIRKIIELAQQYGVCRTMFIAPLSCFKPRFYATGVMFQCIVEKGKHGIVIAAGGRYDSLIRAHQASSDRATKQGAVGVVIAVDAIVNQLMPKSGADRYLKDPVQIQHLPRRVDCQVVTSGTENARVAGIKLVTSLWAANISAELGQDHRASQQQDALFVAHLR
jgi:translation initiation factor 2-alpha kinase 4